LALHARIVGYAPYHQFLMIYRDASQS